MIGLFSSREQAEEAVRTLRHEDYTGEISVVAKDDREVEDNNYRTESNEYRQRYNQTGLDPRTTDGTSGEQQGEGQEGEVSYDDQNLSDGTLTGGALGGLAGLALGAGALVIPGLGPIIAAGPLAGILTGALTGGVAGGFN